MTMTKTDIEWTGRSWNFQRGCTRASAGCGTSNGGGCYAEKIAARYSGPGLAYEGLAKFVTRPDGSKEARWTGKIVVAEHKFYEPLALKDPEMIFVNSMSDFFHEGADDETIHEALDVMEHASQHVYQVLTKRSERMRDFIQRRYGKSGAPKHIWLGVSVESRKVLDRIDHLQATPAETRFLSIEPLLEALGPLDLHGIH